MMKDKWSSGVLVFVTVRSPYALVSESHKKGTLIINHLSSCPIIMQEFIYDSNTRMHASVDPMVREKTMGRLQKIKKIKKVYFI